MSYFPGKYNHSKNKDPKENIPTAKIKIPQQENISTAEIKN